MSIGQRLSLSFSLILLLFAANLGINWWGSRQRAETLYQLRNAVDRQFLANDINQTFAQRKKEISVFIQISDTALNKNEVGEITAKLDRVNNLAEHLRRRTSLENAEGINTFISLYDEIRAEWLRLYTSNDQSDYKKVLPKDIVEKADQQIETLKDIEKEIVLAAAINDKKTAAFVQRLNLIVFTISTFLALLVSFLLIRYLRSNIHILKHGAETIGKGNLDDRIDINVKDEFSDLANSFNQMATKLKSAMDEANNARDEAEHANESKSAFLANMSHELRTPMNAIIGYSEILIEDAEDAGVKEFEDDLNKIRAAGKHLLSLINDVLDISKIEAGKMTIYLESFDLQDLVNDVVSTSRPMIEQNQNKVEVYFTPLPHQMYADSTKIRQILFNLLSNASKFTENGKITLTVNVEDHEQTQMVRFEVVDTGIGMAEDQLDRVFGEFSQADNSTTRKYGGTGLGLAISKRFCTMLGGSISVESKLNYGSKFTVMIPLNISKITDKELSIDKEVQASGKTVLVIDDDTTMHDLLRRFLVKDGYYVASAMSGEQGLKSAKELKPDVITLDVLMPGMDGWAVLNALKLDEDTRNIPVIMLTMMDDKNLGYSLGAMKYINKPVERNELLSSIKSVTQNNSANDLLIVDDDPEARELIEGMLNKGGWNIAEAENGKQAIARLKIFIPTVILLALKMPEMDGLTFLNHLRINDEWREIPVIVLTGGELTNDELRELKNTSDVVLIETGVDQSELHEQLKSALEEFATS